MERRDFIAGLGLAVAFAAAAGIIGEYNSWQGYNAGRDATGDRATVQGAAAGSEAQRIERTEFIGAAAGAFSENVQDSVGLGYRALREANGVSNVVAIGRGAFAGKTNLTNATWINGQFFAGGGKFYIKPDLSAADEEAPLYYVDGMLFLNADRIVMGDGGIVAGRDETMPAAFDFYVSANTGDDSNPGTSRAAPKKTIDAALELVASHDTTICVMAGTYKVPQWFSPDTSRGYSPFRVQLFAPAGNGKTVIDGALNDDGERLIIHGHDTAWTRLEGFAFKHMKLPKYVGSGTFESVYLRNCVFSDMELEGVHTTCMPFIECVLDSCRMMPSVSVSAAAYMETGSEYYYSGMGYGCEVYDSILEWSNSADSPEVLNSFSATRFVNSFVHAPVIAHPPTRGTTTKTTVYGGQGGMTDTTFIADGAASPYTYANNSRARDLVCTNCIVGITCGDAAWTSSNTNSSNTISMTAAEALSLMGADFKPATSDIYMLSRGYDSAGMRKQRETIKAIVAEEWQLLRDRLIDDDAFNEWLDSRINMQQPSE